MTDVAALSLAARVVDLTDGGHVSAGVYKPMDGISPA